MAKPHYIPKIAVDVEIALNDGSIHRGQVYIAANQRVLDMLNEANGFFPFREQKSGEVTLLSKTIIAAVTPLDQRG
ncbi:hypothetical protein ACFOGJ_19215 [Marinibaculum pumilum]|uniref:Uncharacterized protein n=1 Tax=Marinibaculum pumilum TaxID=1766165 RepID=A0ABV7L457_9PROT